MTSLDAVALGLTAVGKQSLRGTRPLCPSLAAFFANCTAAYVQAYEPSVLVLSPEEVVQCSSAWSSQVDASLTRSLDTSESTQADELRLWSPFEGGYSEQQAILAKQVDCAANVTRFWWSAAGQMSPESAATNATAYVAQLYDNGECT